MANEIELSIMESSTDLIRPLLDQFLAETGIRVRVRLMDWDVAWNELVRAALYKDGPDISEIGTSWVGDLIGMNALRSFQPAEVSSFGRADAFIPVAWKAATAGDATLWSIPWMCGSRIIYYRKDWLARAGLEPASAFQNPEVMDNSMLRLAESGCRMPWLAPLTGSHENLHHLATWVWAEGGELLRPDQKGIALLEPGGLRGMQAYFALGRFFPPEVRKMVSTQAQELFVASPDAGAILSGPWLADQLRATLGPAFEEQIGMALPPGPSFVGGSNLVIWKYSRQPEAAVRLVRFLTSKAIQLAYCHHSGLLPARVEALNEPPYNNEPLYQVTVQTLLSGRSFPVTPLWGLVEERMMAGINSVWNTLLNNPQEEIRPLLIRTFDPIRKRLDLLLEGK